MLKQKFDRLRTGKTFTPGEGHSTKESFFLSFTPEQKVQIREMITNVKTPADIERMEECVKRGEFLSILSTVR